MPVVEADLILQVGKKRIENLRRLNCHSTAEN